MSIQHSFLPIMFSSSKFNLIFQKLYVGAKIFLLWSFENTINIKGSSVIVLAVKIVEIKGKFKMLFGAILSIFLKNIKNGRIY